MSPAARVKAEPRTKLLLPDPDRQWIRYAPRSWPCAPAGGAAGSGVSPLWLDLAGDRLGAPGEPGCDEIELPAGPFDDVLYLPPVTPGLQAARDRAAAEVAAQGTPVLVQLLPGEAAPDAEGVVALYDLLEPLVAEDLAALSKIPAGVAAVWPLVAGLTDTPDLRDEGVRRLAEAGVGVLQAVSPDLPPADRRRLFERRSSAGIKEVVAAPARRPQESLAPMPDEEEVYRALFHAGQPDPRLLARAARAQGLAPFLPRPLPRPPLSGAPNRQLAGLLALAGELHVRLDRLAPGQACFRAARGVDQSPNDIRALARDGNLHVLPWLDPMCRSIVDEWSEAGTSATVDALLSDYTRSVLPALPIIEKRSSPP